MTAEQLDAAVLKRCFWSAATAPLTQSERLLIADEEISGTLFPKIIAAHADYYLTTQDTAIVAGQEFYRLPGLAYGPLKDIVAVDDSGNEYSLTLLDAADLGHGYRAAGSGDVAAYAMYFRGDFLGLRPVPSASSGRLRVRYYRQPSPLALAAMALRVLTVAPLTIADALQLSDTVAWVPGDSVDVISNGNAHQLLADAADIDEVDGDSVRLNGFDVVGAGISRDDWVILAGSTPIVQVPDFMAPATVRQVASACLAANGDGRAGGEAGEARRLLELALRTAIPRIEGEPRVTRTRNSPFRRGWR